MTYEKLKEIKKNIENESISLLEIGAGVGTFVKKVSSNLINKNNIVCTEYSKYGNDIINNFGIKCYNKDIRKIEDPIYKNSFYFICIFQVLEHIDNIDTFFDKINWFLKPKGNLFITVPNSKQREFYQSKRIYEDLPPVHISRWNIDNFINIAKNFNWEIVNYKIESQSYLSKIKRFAGNHYIKLIPFQINKKISNILFRRLTKSFYLLLSYLISLPSLYKLQSDQYGTSQWIHIVKK